MIDPFRYGLEPFTNHTAILNGDPLAIFAGRDGGWTRILGVPERGRAWVELGVWSGGGHLRYGVRQLDSTTLHALHGDMDIASRAGRARSRVLAIAGSDEADVGRAIRELLAPPNSLAGQQTAGGHFMDEQWLATVFGRSGDVRDPLTVEAEEDGMLTGRATRGNGVWSATPEQVFDALTLIDIAGDIDAAPQSAAATLPFGAEELREAATSCLYWRDDEPHLENFLWRIEHRAIRAGDMARSELRRALQCLVGARIVPSGEAADPVATAQAWGLRHQIVPSMVRDAASPPPATIIGDVGALSAVDVAGKQATAFIAQADGFALVNFVPRGDVLIAAAAVMRAYDCLGSRPANAQWRATLQNCLLRVTRGSGDPAAHIEWALRETRAQPQSKQSRPLNDAQADARRYIERGMNVLREDA